MKTIIWQNWLKFLAVRFLNWGRFIEEIVPTLASFSNSLFAYVEGLFFLGGGGGGGGPPTSPIERAGQQNDYEGSLGLMLHRETS